MLRCYFCEKCGTIEKWCASRTEDVDETKCACGKKAHRDFRAEHCGVKHVPGCWPMKSIALGVQPHQIKEAREYAAKYGVPTEFTKEGLAILTSPKHRREYAELHGLYDKDGGYGDPQRGKRRGELA